MTAERLVEVLLDLDSAACLEALMTEASVHLPRRGKVWVAAFRDEHGEPRWRSTGLTDRKAAQAIADEMEAAARRKRAELGIQTRSKTRVRAGSGQHALGQLTQREVATIMKISERAVRAIERRAIEKLRNHPVLKEVMREWQGRGIDEGGHGTDCQLNREEMAAVLALAKTPYERDTVRKLLRMVSAPTTPTQKPASNEAP
jgi:hypothetical protein